MPDLQPYPFDKETEPKSWKRRMIDWIGEVRRKNGFASPNSLDGMCPEYTNKGDFSISYCINFIQSVRTIVEGIRKAEKGQIKHGLESLIQFANTMLESVEGVYTTIEEPKPLSNVQVLEGKLVLVCTEAAEAAEAADAGDRPAFEEEMADIEIRCNEIADALKTEPEFQVEQKMHANSLRPPKHGKKTNI